LTKGRPNTCGTKGSRVQKKLKDERRQPRRQDGHMVHGPQPLATVTQRGGEAGPAPKRGRFI